MKRINKVLALLLATIMILAALPLSVFADVWVRVDAETKKDPATNTADTVVTVTVDPIVLADMLKEKGLSVDLLLAMKDGISLDKSELLKVFTLEELFEIIPRDRWADVLDLGAIADEIGFSTLRDCLSDEEMETLMEAILENDDSVSKIAAMLKDIPNLENCVNAIVLLEGAYLEPTAANKAAGNDLYKLVEKHLLVAPVDLIDLVIIDEKLMDVLSAKIDSYTTAELEEMVHIATILEKGELFDIDEVLMSDAKATLQKKLNIYINSLVGENHDEFEALLSNEEYFPAESHDKIEKIVKDAVVAEIEAKIAAVRAQNLDKSTAVAKIATVLAEYAAYFTVTYDYDTDTLGTPVLAEDDEVVLFHDAWENGWIDIHDLMPEDKKALINSENLWHFFIFEKKNASNEPYINLSSVVDTTKQKAAAIAVVQDEAKLKKLLDPANGYVEFDAVLKAIGMKEIIAHINGGFSALIHPADGQALVNLSATDGLISEIDFVATLKNILDAVKANKISNINDVIYINKVLDALISAGKAVELVKIAPVKLVLSMLSPDELLDILRKIDIAPYAKKIAALVAGQILEYVDRVEIDGELVAQEKTSGTHQLQINAEPLVMALARMLPSLAEMLDEEWDGTLFSTNVKVDYTVADDSDEEYGETKHKNVEFNFVLGGGDVAIAKFQRVLKEMKSLYNVYINEFSFNGKTIRLNLNSPVVVTELFKQIVNSDELDDELKLKVAQLLEAGKYDEDLTVNFYAFVANDLNFQNINDILEALDIEALYAAMRRASYTKVVLEKYDLYTGSNISDLSLQELMEYVAEDDQTLNQFLWALNSNTGYRVKAVLESAAIKYDAAMSKAEKIDAIQKLLNKVEAKVGINVSDISAEDVLRRAGDNKIVDTICEIVMEQFGKNLEFVLNERTAEELYGLALDKFELHKKKVDAAIFKVRNATAKLAKAYPKMRIADCYDGDGKFHVNVDKVFSYKEIIENLADKVLNKLNIETDAVELVMNSIGGDGQKKIALDVTLNVPGIHRILFMDRNAINDPNAKPLYSAFMPTGGDLSIFKNNFEDTGYKFTGWTMQDENGNWVTLDTMPDHDVVVYADGNASRITFKDSLGRVYGTIMLPFGETLTSYQNGAFLAQIEALVSRTPEGYNPNVSGEYHLDWVDSKGTHIDVNTATFVQDTVLIVKLTPNYHMEPTDASGKKLDFDLYEANGVYKLQITDANWVYADGMAFRFYKSVLERAATEDVVFNIYIGDTLFISMDADTMLKLSTVTGDLDFYYGNGYNNKANATTGNDFTGTMFDPDKIGNASAPEYHSFMFFDNALNSDISDFGGVVSVTVPYGGGISDNPTRTQVYTTGVNGGRELVEDVTFDIDNQTVTFNAVHFSDFVILNTYKLAFDFITDENLVVDGKLSGFDEANPYYPAGYTVDFSDFYNLGAYDQIVSVVDQDGNPYTDSFTLKDADVELTVTLTGGIYYIYYYVNGALWKTTQYNKNDMTVAGAQLIPFDTLIADNTISAPAGYSKTGAWVGYDAALLGKSNMTVYAAWDQIEYTYTVKFSANGAVVDALTMTITTTETDLAEILKLIVLPAVPAKADNAAGYYGTWDNGVKDGTTITLTAVYTANTFPIVTDGNVVLKDAAGNVITNSALLGTEITVEAIAKEHFDATVTVILGTKDADGNDIVVALTDGKFAMPADTVYITVTYSPKTYNYTFNGIAGTGLYGETKTGVIVVPADKALKAMLGAACTLISETVDAQGCRVLTYAFVITGDNLTFTPQFETKVDLTPDTNIFDGNIFDGTGEPTPDVDNVKFAGWSEAFLGLSFAKFALINENASLLWLWILLVVLLFVALIVLIYKLHTAGKIGMNFLVRFAIWVVDGFFWLCGGVAKIGLKIAHLFGKSEDPDDYGFTEVKEEKTAEATTEEADEVAEPAIEVEATEEIVEETAEEVVEETADEVVEEATEDVVEETTEEVVEEAIEEVAEETDEDSKNI